MLVSGTGTVLGVKITLASSSTDHSCMHIFISYESWDSRRRFVWNFKGINWVKCFGTVKQYFYGVWRELGVFHCE